MFSVLNRARQAKPPSELNFIGLRLVSSFLGEFLRKATLVMASIVMRLPVAAWSLCLGESRQGQTFSATPQI
jgi:hypothetical protein